MIRSFKVSGSESRGRSFCWLWLHNKTDSAWDTTLIGHFFFRTTYLVYFYCTNYLWVKGIHKKGVFLQHYCHDNKLTLLHWIQIITLLSHRNQTESTRSKCSYLNLQILSLYTSNRICWKERDVVIEILEHY